MHILCQKMDTSESRDYITIMTFSPSTERKKYTFGTEYDRANFSPLNGKRSPPSPGSLKALLLPPLFEQSAKQGVARAASEVRHGNSSIYFLCPARPTILGMDACKRIVRGFRGRTAPINTLRQFTPPPELML